MSTFGGDSGFHSTPGEGSQVVLTEEEQRLVAKLLGDPTYFPVEFRRWLKDYIENAGIKITEAQIIGGGAAGAGAATTLPPGIILGYAGTTFGADCLPCNNAQLDKDAYPELFAAIGYTWGGSGQTFRVPDLRDRAPYGVGSVLSIGQVDGASLGNRGPKHYHAFSKTVNTSQDGNHSHPYGTAIPQYEQYYGGYAPTFTVFAAGSQNTGNAGNHNHSVNVAGNTSGGGAQDTPGFAAVQFVITTGKS